MKRRFLHIAIMVCVTLHANAITEQWVNDGRQYRDSLYQHIAREGFAELVCRFTYQQGDAMIRRSLDNNAYELSRLDAFIHSAMSHPEMHIKRVCLTGYSSIEGSYATNESLSHDRVESFYDYLRNNYPVLHGYPCNIAWVAEDWKGLSAMVRESRLNEREEILEIIRKIRDFDVREALLVKLNGGRPYSVMERTMLPQLRRVEIQIEYSTTPSPVREAASTVFTPPVKTEPVQQPKPVEVKERTPEPEPAVVKPSTVNVYVNKTDGTFLIQKALRARTYFLSSDEELYRSFSIKTNLLSWGGVMPDVKYTTPLPNLAVEYYINHRWSVEAAMMYSYWRYDSSHKFQGISGYRLEPRWWLIFPGERLGMYLGLYGRLGDYDIRRPEKDPETGIENDYTTNYTGKYWDAGLSGGLYIQLPYNWAIEVGARFGYVKTKTTLYTKEDKYNYFERYEPYDKFRVTDLSINLVYCFGRR